MNKNQLSQTIKVCRDNFFTHPNWNSVLELIEYYIEDLKDVDSIDTNKSNDEIATELRARQIVKTRLQNFIDDSLTLARSKDVPTKTRKFK